MQLRTDISTLILKEGHKLIFTAIIGIHAHEAADKSQLIIIMQAPEQILHKLVSLPIYVEFAL